jgi:hypothetical protein
MTPDREHQDPQDKEFGSRAAADQEKVDELEAEGVGAEEMPDTPAAAPRAAGKAEPSE